MVTVYNIVSAKDFNEARKKIRESKGKPVAFYSNNDELVRKVLEKEKVKMILLNLAERKDKVKERGSGFNQVLAKLAKKKNTTIGIDLDEVFEAEGKKKAEVLARIRQNIKLCNKDRLDMEFISKKSKNHHELAALGTVLGMPTWMTKKL